MHQRIVPAPSDSLRHCMEVWSLLPHTLCGIVPPPSLTHCLALSPYTLRGNVFPATSHMVRKCDSCHLTHCVECGPCSSHIVWSVAPATSRIVWSVAPAPHTLCGVWPLLLTHCVECGPCSSHIVWKFGPCSSHIVWKFGPCYVTDWGHVAPASSQRDNTQGMICVRSQRLQY